METLYFIDTTLNSSGLRRVNMHGKTYIIVDTTILKPRVLKGNKGPLYYPKDQIAESFNRWLGIPLLTPSHPLTENGQPVLGISPYAWAKYDVGRFYAKGIDNDGGIFGESWFDEDEVRRKEPRLLDRLNSKQNIEISTGLHHSTLEHDKRIFENVEYNHTATNYKPDHIAVLLDEKGACETKHGCGIVFNSTGESSVEKTQLIEWLTINCNCWKDPADKETLDKMDVEKLKKLKANAEEAKRNSLVVNSVSKTFGEDILTVNSADAFESKVKEKSKEWHKVEDKKETTNNSTNNNNTNNTTTNSTQTQVKPMDMKEWLSNMPEDAKPVWNNMVDSLNREKQSLCDRLASHLTNNSQDEKVRKAAFDSYAKLNIDQLRELASTIPATTNNSFGGVMMPGVPVYAGAQGGYVPSNQEKEPERLGLSGWNSVWNSDNKKTA